MRYTNFKLFTCLLLIGLFGVQSRAHAVDIDVKALPLKGSDSTLAATKVITIYDSVLTGAYGWKVRNVRNLITLKIDEFANLALPDSFRLSVIYTLSYKVWPSTTLQTRNDTLVLTYNKNKPYSNKSIYVNPGVYYSSATIVSVTSNYGSIPLASFLKSIMLESEIQSSRDYLNFDCGANAVQTLSKDPQYVATQGELLLSWPAVLEADEYDLEWAVIDAGALSQYYIFGTSTPDPVKIFSDNATRVSLSNAVTSYKVPLLYEAGTILFARVRSVQVLARNQRKEAFWSSGYTNGLARYDITGGLAPTLDWQATTSFAEEGKRKSVVQFYDGTLRSRQTVTKDNTKNTTLVAETFYDYQGRPQVQVLPSPTISNIIAYTPNFNPDINGSEYTKSKYDKALSLYCGDGAEAMGAQGGAAKYYSPQNPDVLTGISKFIPDAKGFPFTETKYTQDATGRISEQGGVGAYHQLGQGVSGDATSAGHQTKYYYGSTADQEDLDALFGTEVGLASHYTKNMVKDANGQLSISYVDMHGRTIATSLAGTPPVSVDKLSSNVSRYQTRNLLNGGSNLLTDKYTVQNIKSLLITKAGTHSFSYSLAGDSISIKDCNNQTLCYDCQYDLSITITDDCNNQHMPGGIPYAYTVSNFTLADFIQSPDTTCDALHNIIWQQDIYLPEGAYMITKTLSVNKQALEIYKNQIFLPHNACKTLQQFIDSVKTATLNGITCENTCQACTDSIGTWDYYRQKYMTKLNIPVADTAAHRQDAWLSYTTEKAECDEICNGVSIVKSIYEEMLGDVRAPAGQYANDANVAVAANRYPWSMFSKDLTIGSKLKYQVPATDYVDDNGNLSLVNGLRPEQLSAQDFSDNFQDSWATALLPKHPEYARYLRLQKFRNSIAWDDQFNNTQTYADAHTKGYLNPTGKNASPFTIFNSVVTANVDPFYKICLDSFGIANKVTSMENFMLDVTAGTVTGGINIWGLANASVRCNSDDAACYSFYTQNANAFNSGMCTGDLDQAWKVFRDQYRARKTKLMYEVVVLNTPITPAIPVNVNDADHTLRIMTPEEATGTGLGGGATTPGGYTDNVNATLAAQVADACQGYADQWMTDLGTCNYTEAQKTALKAQLVNVCKAGGDISHPLGASTVATTSTYTPRSFEAVLLAFNAANGITTNINCNADLITAPLPYELQTTGVFENETVTGTPDSCLCAKLSGLYSDYTRQYGSTISFATFVNQQLSISMTDSDLNKLLGLCNSTIGGDCNALDVPIIIPPALQCIPNACISCTQMQTYYNGFRLKYLNAAVVLGDDISPAQIQINKVFENYMNHITGFNKTATDYVVFMNTCGIAPAVLLPYPAGASCAQLQDALDGYRNSLYSPAYDTDGTETGVWAISPHNIGRDFSSYHLKDFIRNGIVSTPDSITAVPGDFSYNYQKTFCLTHEFSWETRTRVKAGFNANVCQLELRFQFDNSLVYALFTKDASYNGFVGYTPSDPYFADYNYQDINVLMDKWTKIKITFKANRIFLYIDDMLKASRPYTGAWNYMTAFAMCGRADTPMEYDYVKMYDQYNNQVFYEDFSDSKDFEKPPYQWVCSKPDCATNFTSYFNTKFGSSYTFAQIQQLYTLCGITNGPCEAVLPKCALLESTLASYQSSLYTATHAADGSETGTWKLASNAYTRPVTNYNFKDFVGFGMINTPDSVTQYRGDFLYTFNLANVAGKEFSFESRLRIKPGFNANLAQPQFTLYAKNGTSLVTPTTLLFNAANAYYNGLQGSYRDTTGSNTSFTYWNTASMYTVFDVWKTVRLTFVNDRLRVFIDNQLKGDFYYPGKYLQGIDSMSVGGWNDLPLQFDYVKVLDKYGNTGYAEEFNDPTSYAKLPYQWNANKPADCQTAFTTYFNTVFGTSYTYAQIVALYKKVCNKDLALCPVAPGPMLCASASLFPDFNPPTKCDLAVNGATDLGTQLYNAYADSLRSSFEDRYLRRCTNVFSREVFTVSDSTSEFHYTLYYYDQSGNLVKTVPPEGVNLIKMDSKTAWSASVRAAAAAGTNLLLQHGLPTRYRYNTLNQVVSQYTPDAGSSSFWYDRLGRLVISQNAKQKIANGNAAVEANRNYSYTLYDGIGRITEVGEYTNASSTTMTQGLSRDYSGTGLSAWLATNANRKQVTRTVYDMANANWSGLAAADVPVNAANLRNRVAYTQYYPLGDPNGLNYSQATYYSYDIHGNVDTLIQDYGNASLGTLYQNMMNANGNRFKKLVYQYDLISGKVNHVAYQPQYTKDNYLYRPNDALYHKYAYDAENRIAAVYTSTDSIVWEQDAAYSYYKHGPLSRMVLGEQQVQGVDYAYTIQGWLKGVNSSSLAADKDMGVDGLTSNAATRYVARDVTGFSLNYFNGDYSSIGAGAGTASMPLYNTASGVTNGVPNASYRPLYNGNISSMAVNIGKLTIPDLTGTTTTTGAILYDYKYDQLNRLTTMDAFKGLTAANNSWANIIALRNYRERISYDGNGNILTYSRYGNKNSQQLMDSLAYAYNYTTAVAGVIGIQPQNNKLRRVVDNMTTAAAYDETDATTGVSDIEHQSNTDNYSYDEIGNLITDAQENINKINWNVYGKIQNINFNFVANKTKVLTYLYDASGNRIGKQAEKYGATAGAATTSTYTWYVRDASGNVMGVYSTSGTGATLPATLSVVERHLYGSARLGVLSLTADVKTTPQLAINTPYTSTFMRGNKFFELSNHLGNVLATISDRKDGVDDGTYDAGGTKTNSTPDGRVDYYTADVVTAQDYYPFGMLMPGRVYKAATAGSYRYGFNGKENDNEVKGTGNQYDYGARIQDPRLGRWFSVDAITKPFITPYNFSGNNPVNFIDPDGDDEIHFFFLYDKTGLGNEKFGKLTKFVVIIRNNEPNTFIHHKATLVKNASGTQTLTDVQQEFYPMNRGHSSGLTRSKIFGFHVNDDDYTTLMKYTDEFPELQQEAKYTELSNPGSAPTRKMQNIQFWGSVIANNKARKDEDDKQELRGEMIKTAIEFAITDIAFTKGAALALRALESMKAAKAVIRSLDDLSSLRGATWEETESLIPKDWIKGTMKKGEGVKFVNPAKKGEQILLEKGWQGAKDPLHAGPYMKVSRNGQVTRIPLSGNPTLK